MGRGSFAAVLRGPAKLRSQAMILHMGAGRPGVSRLGLIAPKRLARRSVDRNRLKRLAREAFRRHEVKTAGLDLVLAAREPYSRGTEAEWLMQIRDLLGRAAERR